MIELRGIAIDSPEGVRRVRLTIRSERGDDYETLEFPASLLLNRGQIIKFLGDHYGIEPGKIVWPSHVKIPGEK